jgi:glutamate-1-semialdehyde 2,1-aminomutase
MVWNGCKVEETFTNFKATVLTNNCSKFATNQANTMELKDTFSRVKSEALFAKAKTLFPGGVNSPVRAFKSVHGSPLFIKKGSGAYITDEDDNVFIDFCGSWGPLILGHDNAAVREAIIAAVSDGTSFGTPTKYGVELGSIIVDNHRYIDKLRFVCSGTEAVMSAIRLARGFTGKNKIVKFEGCYHGHVDSLMVKAGSGLVTFGTSTSAGVPEDFAKNTHVLPLNDLAGLTQLLDDDKDIAAVIIEPIPANNGLLLQDNNFLAWVRKLCDDHKVLLIFDEVISGFRVGFEGAAGYYAIKPDLITFGKIIGGGLPVGAYGGREDIMAMIAPDGPVYQAGTLSANPVTISAGIAALKQLLAPDFYEQLATHTLYLTNGLNQVFAKHNVAMQCINIGSIFWIKFTTQRICTADEIGSDMAAKFKLMHHALLQKGIYFGPSGYEVGFVSAAHTKADLDKLIVAMDEIVASHLTHFSI